MAQYLDLIRIGNNRAVISAVYDSGVHIVYEDAVCNEDGVWRFVDVSGGAYAKNQPHLREAIEKLKP